MSQITVTTTAGDIGVELIALGDTYLARWRGADAEFAQLTLQDGSVFLAAGSAKFSEGIWSEAGMTARAVPQRQVTSADEDAISVEILAGISVAGVEVMPAATEARRALKRDKLGKLVEGRKSLARRLSQTTRAIDALVADLEGS